MPSPLLKTTINLPPAEIWHAICQSLCKLEGYRGYRGYKRYEMHFPLAISDDIRSFVILRTLYTTVLSEGVSLTSTTVPLDFNKGLERNWPANGYSDDDVTDVMARVRSLVWGPYTYRFLFSPDGRILYFADFEEACDKPVIALFDVKDAGSRVVLRAETTHFASAEPEKLAFHPTRSILFMLRDNHVCVWQYDLQAAYRGLPLCLINSRVYDEAAKLSESELPSFRDRYSSHITDISVSACGDYLHMAYGPLVPGIIPLDTNFLESSIPFEAYVILLKRTISDPDVDEKLGQLEQSEQLESLSKSEELERLQEIHRLDCEQPSHDRLWRSELEFQILTLQVFRGFNRQWLKTELDETITWLQNYPNAPPKDRDSRRQRLEYTIRPVMRRLYGTGGLSECWRTVKSQEIPGNLHLGILGLSGGHTLSGAMIAACDKGKTVSLNVFRATDMLALHRWDHEQQESLRLTALPTWPSIQDTHAIVKWPSGKDRMIKIILNQVSKPSYDPSCARSQSGPLVIRRDPRTLDVTRRTILPEQDREIFEGENQVAVYQQTHQDIVYSDHKAISAASTSSSRQYSMQKRSAPDWSASEPQTHPLRHVTKRIKKSSGLDIMNASPT
jgi:hypothetical protein